MYKHKSATAKICYGKFNKAYNYTLNRIDSLVVSVNNCRESMHGVENMLQ